MPLLNGRGAALMGVGGGPGSVDGRPLVAPGGGGAWLDDDHVIVQTTIGGAWIVVIIDVRNGEVQTPAPARGANALVAGGGRWAAFLASSPSLVYGALGELVGASLYAAGPDGTIAWKRSYLATSGMTLTTSAGSTVDLLDALPLDVQVLGPGQAVWQDLRGLRAVGVSVPRPAVPPGRLRLATVDGETWLVYWSEGVGIVAQVDGAADGYILEPRPIAFNHDARAVDGQLVVAWSTTQGEGPGDLVKMTVDRMRPRVPIVPAPAAVPAIARACLVAWFTDRPTSAPGNADVWVDYYGNPSENLIRRRDTGAAIAHYVAAEAGGTIDALEAAIAVAKRAMPLPVVAYWNRGLQAGRAPIGAEYVGVEAYRLASESVDGFEARVRAAVARCPAAVLIAQSYTSNGTQTTDLPSVVPVYARIARDCRNVVGILPFSAGSRKTGFDDHPEVHDAWTVLVAGVTGVPDLAVISPPVDPPKPPPPVPPIPPAPPVPPAPTSAFVLLTTFGGSMQTERGGLVGPAGKFARVVPGTEGRGLFGGFVIEFDADGPDGDAEFELSKPDDRGCVTHVATGRILGWDATQFSADLAHQYYTIDAGKRGGYESPQLVAMPSGLKLLVIEYADPRGYIAAPLAWSKKAA